MDLIRNTNDSRTLPMLWKDVLGDGTVYALQIYSANGGGGGGGGADRELVVTVYRANKNFTGAVTGNLITSTKMIDVTGASPVQVGATAWRNETQDTVLASAPLAADLDLAGGGGGATNAEMTALFAAQNALLGTKTDASTALPTGGTGIIGWLSNIWQSFFGVASGTADSGNPLKTGGRYSAAALALTSGQRSDTMVSLRGSALTATDFGSVSAGDSIGSTVARYQTDRLGADSMPIMANALFDGTNWLRARGTVNGAWTQGNVASNGTDVGNPVKVGGVYSATVPAFVDGRRGDLQLSPRGSLVTTPDLSSNALADATASTSAALAVSRGGVEALPMAGGMVFDPATANYARQRGDTAGTFVQGPVAAAATQTGKPVPTGGVYNTAPTTLTNGQAGHVRLGNLGEVMMVQPSGPALGDAMTATLVSAPRAYNSANAAVLANTTVVFNGTTYDRMRGDTTGLQVNVLKTALAAKQLAVTATSAPIQLTASTKRISIYARGADMRFVLANATATAVATTSNFIRQDERLEFNVGDLGTTPWIAAIADALSTTQTGQLEITELS